MRPADVARALLAALLPGCGAFPPPEQATPLHVEVVASAPADVADAAPPPPDAGALDVPCASDEACGFDPGRARCVVDARANRQPEIVDQGILCYCDAGRCATLQVPPVPCESDAACAVAREPRAHPVAADAVHAHGPKNPCREANREIALSAVCEQTNLCTLRRHTCRRR